MTVSLIVDGNNILARCDHAARAQRTHMAVDGVNTSALLLFINSLSRYVRTVRPDAMVVCWDAGHALRDAIYPDYKANRRRRVEVGQGEPSGDHEDETRTPREQAREFCTWAGVPQHSWRGWEADDLIATYCAVTPGDRVVLSGDKDLLQLVDERVVQIRPGSSPEFWDQDQVREHYGCRPGDLPLYFSLVGDAVDGVPGVRGLGPKRAAKVLNEAGWDWDVLVGLLGPERAGQVLLSRRLVDLRYPAYAAYAEDPDWAMVAGPVPGFHPTDPSAPGEQGTLWGPLSLWLDRWRMDSVSQRLVEGTLWVDGAEAPTSEDAAQAFSGFAQ